MEDNKPVKKAKPQFFINKVQNTDNLRVIFTTNRRVIEADYSSNEGGSEPFKFNLDIRNISNELRNISSVSRVDGLLYLVGSKKDKEKKKTLVTLGQINPDTKA